MKDRRRSVAGGHASTAMTVVLVATVARNFAPAFLNRDDD